MRLLMSKFAYLVMAFIVPIAAVAQSASSCSVRDPDLQGTYEGDCIGGLASGKGRAVGKDRYEGGFRDGQLTGFGVYTRANNQRIEGEFVDGKINGRAKIYLVNGDILEGSFADNKLSGLGKITQRSGETFSVELREGKLVRVGTAASPAPQGAAASASVANTETGVKWAPRLDLEDLFPAYILATATRKEPSGPTTPQAPRGDPLSALAATVQQIATPQSQANSVRERLGDRWGLVGVAIRTTEPNSNVVVEVTVDEVAEPTAVQFKLDTPGDYFLYPKLRYKYDKLRSVLQPTPVNITWKLTVNGRVVGNLMRTVTLRSIYDAPYYADTVHGPENLSWVFAAFVTEDAPWIDKILQEALQRRFVQQFVGYQKGPQEVHRQVEAIYNTLQHRGVRYSSITTSSQSSPRVMSQVVRFPVDSINNSQANCIDGTVLMASILRKIGIDAFIILGPNHAMLGYTETGNPQQGFTVVETTMIGGSRFSDATRAGSARYLNWTTNLRLDPRFKLVRVSQARQLGVMPIPR